MPQSLTILAPAKVNWYLELRGKRPDGYHEIETVMQAIDLFDRITVQDAPSLTLTCNINLGPVESNLVYRAAELLRREHAPGKGAAITLEKRIPHGAGLGGGSSDAAAVMVALDRLWGLQLGTDRLRELVARIGSDCAFFVEGGTALCTGRGEIVRQMPDFAGVDVVILYPNVVLPTKDVYADYSSHLTGTPAKCYFSNEINISLNRDWLRAHTTNRLQDSALRISEPLRTVWEQTRNEQGVIVRFVSGSGSALAFAVEDRYTSEALAQSFTGRGLGQAFATRSIGRGAVWD